MRITSKGQVTIPQHIREELGLHPNTEVEFSVEDGRAVLNPKADPPESRRETGEAYSREWDGKNDHEQQGIDGAAA